MKLRLWHHIGAAFLVSFLGMHMTACSGDGQADDVVEGQEGGEGGDGGAEDGGNGTAEGQNGDGMDQAAKPPEANPVAAAPKQDELQELINGMNAKPKEVEGEGLAAALPPPLPPEPQPVPVANAGMPAAPGLPELGSKMSYVIKRGDTLASVAMKVYGDMQKWKEIAEFTGMANPNMIYPGDVVYYQLTEQTMAFASAYESVKQAQVTVKPGDTLSTIASRVLGRSSDWKTIWRQNDGIDNPDRLVVGQTIYYVEPASLISKHDNKDDSTLKIADSYNIQIEPVKVSVEYQGELENSVQNEFDGSFVGLQTIGQLPVI